MRRNDRGTVQAVAFFSTGQLRARANLRSFEETASPVRKRPIFNEYPQVGKCSIHQCLRTVRPQVATVACLACKTPDLSGYEPRAIHVITQRLVLLVVRNRIWSPKLYLMARFGVVGNEMAVRAVGTSITSLLASIAFRGWEGLQSRTNEQGLPTKQNLQAESRGRVQPRCREILLGSQG